jgi:hypothetical protein
VKPGDRVRTPAGPAVIVGFHYEPMSLGVRNVRRLAFVIVQTADHLRHLFPPNTITEENTMTTYACSTTDVDESGGQLIQTLEEPAPEPDPTPPPTAPADDDEQEPELTEWP